MRATPCPRSEQYHGGQNTPSPEDIDFTPGTRGDAPAVDARARSAPLAPGEQRIGGVGGGTLRVVDAYLALVSKRDTRRYAERAIREAVVRRVVEAGRLAGSSRNRQPWRS
jgi:hypothetical protein